MGCQQENGLKDIAVVYTTTNAPTEETAAGRGWRKKWEGGHSFVVHAHSQSLSFPGSGFSARREATNDMFQLKLSPRFRYFSTFFYTTHIRLQYQSVETLDTLLSDGADGAIAQ